MFNDISSKTYRAVPKVRYHILDGVNTSRERALYELEGLSRKIEAAVAALKAETSAPTAGSTTSPGTFATPPRR